MRLLRRLFWFQFNLRCTLARLILPRGQVVCPQHAWEFYLREGIGKVFTRFADGWAKREPSQFYVGRPKLEFKRDDRPEPE